jgi:hypothetical protein
MLLCQDVTVNSICKVTQPEQIANSTVLTVTVKKQKVLTVTVKINLTVLRFILTVRVRSLSEGENEKMCSLFWSHSHLTPNEFFMVGAKQLQFIPSQSPINWQLE